MITGRRSVDEAPIVKSLSHIVVGQKWVVVTERFLFFFQFNNILRLPKDTFTSQNHMTNSLTQEKQWESMSKIVPHWGRSRSQQLHRCHAHGRDHSICRLRPTHIGGFWAYVLQNTGHHAIPQWQSRSSIDYTEINNGFIKDFRWRNSIFHVSSKMIQEWLQSQKAMYWSFM